MFHVKTKFIVTGIFVFGFIQPFDNHEQKKWEPGAYHLLHNIYLTL